ncbi:hypothetical protein POSPLADRAFT_1061204 [Postia placenta MAD-698-R-SB12]|uniref:Cytochrome P450 n=1 Tax=Postia placenta MAD-698-R-SB12 TaxID=670580 RepID=A0A1X6MPN7_9APHY|nr:hypothetical protein POSPLADRAFT_1061204 [Postia placenta MAD-698-R-SB12]OSX58093.1 hypothetical protein POSPLADRAFT_1061204 [Postia placenta MAD-698-R-SB12]
MVSDQYISSVAPSPVLYFLFVFFVCVWFLRVYLLYRETLKRNKEWIGPRTLIGDETVFSQIFRPIPGISLGYDYPWLSKHNDYPSDGCDAYFMVSAFPVGYSSLWLSDAAAIKEIASSRLRFPKPVKLYKVLLIFGPNIVASEFDSWKRYRRMVASAFSDRNHEYVWYSASKLGVDLLDNVFKNEKEVVLDDVTEITLPLALYMIAIAGFGREVTFQHDGVVPHGHKMSFKAAIDIIAKDIFLKLLLPTFAFTLHPRLRKLQLAFEEIEEYIKEMIRERQTSTQEEGRPDLLNNLLEANGDSEIKGEKPLTDEELIANVFIFLLGGHEASSQALAFALAALSIHPDEQKALYQQIKQVMPNGELPRYEDIHLLAYSLAVINETLRMYPPVNASPKYCAEDTVITVTNASGSKKLVPVPKNTKIFLHITGVHYNPRYWKDPHVFNPSRFLADYPREAFIPFSSGSRSCIGRKFFETEAVAILSLIISRYKVSIKEDPRYAHETFEEKKQRIFTANIKLTLTAANQIPLVFTRR